MVPADPPRTGSGGGPVLRTLVAGAALFCLLQIAPIGPQLVAPTIGLALAVGCLLLVATRSRRRHDARVGLWVVVLGLVCGVAMAVAQSLFVTSGSPATIALSVVLVLAAAVAVGAGGRRADLAFAVVLAAYALLAVGDLALVETRIDVRPLLEGGLDATLSGSSPYGITVPNPFTAAESAQYLGPGTVVDGRIVFGYPYLPAPLLLDLPAHLLGDARWMHLASILGAGVLAWRTATDRIGRAASVLLVVNPLTTTVLIAYWIEPVMVMFLALAAWGMVRGNRATGVALGLFFASKQYAVSYVPTLWTVVRSSGWRTVWTAALVGGVVVGAFVVWDPRAFVHSVIDFHLVQPFRRDSVSLLPGLDTLVGPLPAWMLSAAPLLGFVVSALVAVRTRPGPTAMSLGVGLSLLVTVLFSKQGHTNYYFLIGAALLLAVVTWPHDDPVPGTAEDA
ncbi:hypothetical protein [Nocardioides currus]|uniref:DUF2029 domain-containing protein n=1 Tax=Nocardioides currus TaxID=2133958 RepID=A0A2R7YXI9_9ACTN|nr:hypothetical protein [Nocardioides currus]PUA80599.1 hypothetical protein C7S10_12630 [Nocardioides currus]